MVTLLELSAELGSDLQPVDGGAATSSPLSGVHVSELEDPTPYLQGGELLLTTGMPLGETESIRAYVSRLQAKEIHALGIGVGPWLVQVPKALTEACRESEVQLLVVPEEVPFQNVSRAFWGLSARSGKADLMGSLGTQTALARATMRTDAIAAVIRGMAQELNGWAAYLPVGSSAETYWPSSVQNLLPRLRAETRRLNRTGVHSAATFELHGRPVVEYPIADGEKILGFLAVGPGRTITAADRQIILTVCTLLAIKTRQRQAAMSTAATFAASVAKLLLQGQAEAARMLAEDAGLQDLPPRVRVLALEAAPQSEDDDAASLISHAAQLLPSAGELGENPLRYQDADVVYLVLTQRVGEQNLDRQYAHGQQARHDDAGVSATLKAVLSEPVLLSEADTTVPVLRRALRRAPVGRVVSAAEGEHVRADEWVQALGAHTGADLLVTVASYLRHRGHWENAARELGLHRNSVRHRISIAESLLGVDLNDPDVSAPLWLALRCLSYTESHY